MTRKTKKKTKLKQKCQTRKVYPNGSQKLEIKKDKFTPQYSTENNLLGMVYM